MKQGKIYMKAWLDLHGRAKVLATDHWYLEFANLLLPVVSESYLYKSETQESQNQVTLMLTLYLEDCVTDGGNWRQFIRWHKRNYGRYLPFYELSEGYLTDEINKEDIAFLLLDWPRSTPRLVLTPYGICIDGAVRLGSCPDFGGYLAGCHDLYA